MIGLVQMINHQTCLMLTVHLALGFFVEIVEQHTVGLLQEKDKFVGNCKYKNYKQTSKCSTNDTPVSPGAPVPFNV